MADEVVADEVVEAAAFESVAVEPAEAVVEMLPEQEQLTQAQTQFRDWAADLVTASKERRKRILRFRDCVLRAVDSGIPLSLTDRARIRMAVSLSRMCGELEAALSTELVLELDRDADALGKQPRWRPGWIDAAGLIDWENFDPDKFLQLVEAILKILAALGWV